MSWRRVWLRTVDQARVALPVVVMAGLAGYTWWLVQSVPEPAGADRPEPPATVPDYVLNQAQVERFDAKGQRTSVMQGKAMSHYATGDRLLVSHFYLQSEAVEGARQPGQRLQAWALEGRYLGEQGVVELVGQAKVAATQAQVGQAPLVTTFTGEQLRWQVNEQLLTTERPVQVTSSQGTVRGNRLRHDARTGLTDLSGRVTGVLPGQ